MTDLTSPAAGRLSWAGIGLIVLAAAAVTTFARRSRSDATIVTVVLLLVAGFYLVAFLSGNSSWITDRY